MFSPAYSVDQTIYGSSGAELYRSTNGGDAWQTIVAENQTVFDASLRS